MKHLHLFFYNKGVNANQNTTRQNRKRSDIYKIAVNIMYVMKTDKQGIVDASGDTSSFVDFVEPQVEKVSSSVDTVEVENGQAKATKVTYVFDITDKYFQDGTIEEGS